jgi:tetratricopeptide (TPR) repeat protein
MLRPMALSLLALSAAPAFAGSVPDEALQDAAAGYFRKALVIVEPLAKSHPQDAELQYRYGEALLGMRKADDAIAALKAAVALDPNNGIYHGALGEAYGLAAQQGFTSKDTGMFKMMGLANSMSKELETAVQLAPTDLEAHMGLAEYYINAPGFFGGSFRKAHVEEDAIAKLDKVAELKVRAEDAAKQDDVAAGESLYKQAIALDKTSGSLMSLGIFYTGAKRYDDAIKTFHDTEAKDPKAYGAWYQIGKAAGLGKSHYDDGIDSLKHYLSVEDLPDNVPTPAWAHYRLGGIYEQQGHADLARAEYETATRLNDGDGDLASKLKDAQSRIK